jgi:predicted dehydrogenase
MLKVGVIGTGSIGRHHCRIYSEMEGISLAAIVDSNMARAQEFADQYNCKAYTNHMDIMSEVDAVSIAVPTTLHHSVAMDFLRHDKDILLEKPITSTMQQADELISEADRRGLIIQVGHLERFNSGVTLISGMVEKPKFIESQRLSPFLGRGTDVDVTLDLMIHDIDIILSLVNSDISDIRATGATVLTDNIDVAHAWIEFENGCIAEAVTSRIADNKVRKLKVFQQNSSMDLDYQSQEISCFKKKGDELKKEVLKAERKEPLKEQLISFIDCVTNRTDPIVSGHAGREALKIALKVSELVYHENMQDREN